MPKAIAPQHSVFYAFVIIFIIGCSSTEQENPITMSPSFIFNPENHKKRSADFSSIYTLMGKYYEGVEKAKIPLLQEVFHETWVMRDTDTPEEASLNVEDKPTFIKRVSDHGPYPGYAADRVFANFGMANEELAFVRINKDPSRNSTGFFLYKIAGEWTIMDKIFVNTRTESTSILPSQRSYATVESILQDYFEALASSDRATLDSLLHQQWNLKYLDKEGELQIETKPQLLAQIEAQPNFMDYNQLMTIDIYHDKLSIVRIDLPSKSTTSFIVLFKIAGTWQIASERKTIN